MQADELMDEIGEAWRQLEADLEGDMVCLDAVVSNALPDPWIAVIKTAVIH